MKSKRIDIWIRGNNKYGIVARNVKIMKFLNRITKHYPKWTKFVEGDEPIFYFNGSQIESIASRSTQMRRMMILAGLPLVQHQ